MAPNTCPWNLESGIDERAMTSGHPSKFHSLEWSTAPNEPSSQSKFLYPSVEDDLLKYGISPGFTDTRVDWGRAGTRDDECLYGNHTNRGLLLAHYPSHDLLA